MSLIQSLQERMGFAFFDYQLECLRDIAVQKPGQANGHLRALLFYKTGAGKSVTALAALRMQGHRQVVIIAPPSTHPAWEATAKQMGFVNVRCMSHALFRMQKTQLSRTVAVIADEFHLFGGHTGKGWKKLDRLAGSLDAPLILASATPNYNDAERVYCIMHVLDPYAVRGGFIEFLHRECNTKHNPFGATPLVDEDKPFIRFRDAAEYLANQPRVFYLADDLVYKINDHDIAMTWPDEIVRFGYVIRDHRIIASIIEERHAKVAHGLLGDDGLIRPHVLKEVERLIGLKAGPTLIFANHSTVAQALRISMGRANARLVTGQTNARLKADAIAEFNKKKVDVLIGTASLATGTDGMDKVCDHLIILDDTDDDALRRQLIGRIMPRGADTDASNKQVDRLVLS